jgi:putative FmdB family regulatory protein
MPTYEYVCRACGHEFESFHSITAAAIRKCPACSKLKVDRKIGIGAGVLFKGGGFYETDYRSDSYNKAADADKKSEAPAVDAKTDSSDAKRPDDKGSATKAAPAPAAPAGPDSAEKSTAKAPVPSDAPSKATHPSRIGRGAGNLTATSAKDRSGRKPAPAAPKKRATKARRAK